MRTGRWWRTWAGLAAVAVAMAAAAQGRAPGAGPGAQQEAERDAAGPWRFTHSMAGPWAQGEHPVQPFAGKTLSIAAGTARGPSVYACGRARVEPTRSPHEGLFQGALPAPATRAAQSLGIGPGPVPGWSLTCDTGLFEFHRIDADTALTALDNRVWVLSRAPGARATAAAPEGRVQSLLERHFAGTMAFDPATVAAKRPWLSAALQQRVAAYFAKPRRRDQVPPINGDPFTDTQETPTRFAVQAASVEGERARVPVRFADAFSQRGVTYLLVREGGRWRVDDLADSRGTLLSRHLD